MTIRYRLFDALDFADLHGQKFTVEVSDRYIILAPAKPGQPLVMLAKAITSRPKPNGQPAETPAMASDGRTLDTVPVMG
jgi:hypothetical protein